MTIFRSSPALLASALLMACSSKAPDRQLACDDIPGLIGDGPRATSAEQYQLVDQCVHKWGFRFALAPGSNSEIARAVIYRCGEAIDDYLMVLSKEGKPPSEPDQQAIERKIGEMALMRVVQQRAGQCSIAFPEDEPLG